MSTCWVYHYEALYLKFNSYIVALADTKAKFISSLTYMAIFTIGAKKALYTASVLSATAGVIALASVFS